MNTQSKKISLKRPIRVTMSTSVFTLLGLAIIIVMLIGREHIGNADFIGLIMFGIFFILFFPVWIGSEYLKVKRYVYHGITLKTTTMLVDREGKITDPSFLFWKIGK